MALMAMFAAACPVFDPIGIPGTNLAWLVRILLVLNCHCFERRYISYAETSTPGFHHILLLKLGQQPSHSFTAGADHFRHLFLCELTVNSELPLLIGSRRAPGQQ